ncbi:ATPase family associated with various cellular activities (AAA) [Nesidiocoris tenuis]|nr:ATPase family associated with various cellular activities (AAA) [Nesidiocoris tenuis]
MPPKTRKSGALWLSCEACSCSINAKDVELHQKSCPPPSSNWDHGYVLNGNFHATLYDMEGKGASAKVPPGYESKIILMSVSALQLCNITTGSQVRIKYGNHIAYRRAWPSFEGSLTSVSVVKSDLEFEWSIQLVSNQVVVSFVDRSVLLAQTVTFSIDDFEEIHSKSNQIICMLQETTHGCLIYPGMRIKVPFYGRNLEITLNNVRPFLLDDLALSMEGLSMDDKAFQTCDTTNWALHSTEATDETVGEENAPKIGGYGDVLNELKGNIDQTIGSKSARKGPLCYGVLLYGVHGVGKTLIAKHLARCSKAQRVDVKGMELFSKYYGETEGKLRAAFEEAIRKSPSIIVMDNVESLCPKKGSDQEKRVASTLISLFDDLQDKLVAVIATSSQPHDIDPAIRRPGRLEMEIEIRVPSAKDRLGILQALVPDCSDSLQEALTTLANTTYGFVGADLSSLVSKAISFAVTAGREFLTEDDLRRAHGLVKPTAMREVYVQVPNVGWGDIGGQKDLKLQLQQAVEWPLKYPDSFKRLGIRPPRGVLMYGPPGCSKTLAAKALASESRINFLSVKGSDVFSKWVGESERAVRDVFKRARSVAPAIVFLDELDALGGERGDGSGGGAVQERVLSQLLTELDGVSPLENVIIIAATNRPDRIDKALLRPGRLDRLIYVPLPTYEDRKRIFEIKFEKMPINDQVDINSLARETEGYSGAEIVNICNDAAFRALGENIEANVVSSVHFMAAIENNRPRTPKSLLDLYATYRRCQ